MNSVWYARLIVHRSLTPLSPLYPLLKKYNRGIVIKAWSPVRAAEARNDGAKKFAAWCSVYRETRINRYFAVRMREIRYFLWAL